MKLLSRTLLIPSSSSLQYDADGHVCLVKNLEFVVKQLLLFQAELRETHGEERAKQLLSELRAEREVFQQRLSKYMRNAIRDLIELEKRTYIKEYIEKYIEDYFDTGKFPSDSLFSMRNVNMRKHYYRAACRRLLEYGRYIEDKTTAIREIEHANKKEWFNRFYHTELHWHESATKPEPCIRVSIKISVTVWKYLELLAAYLGISRQNLVRQLFKLDFQRKHQPQYIERIARSFKMILAYHAITHQKIGTLPPSLNPLNIEQANNILDHIKPAYSRLSEPAPLGKYIYSLFPNVVRTPFNRRKKFREQRFLRIVGVPYGDPVPSFSHTHASLHEL